MKYAVITGASSGLGVEFVKQLHNEYKCVLVARREDRLKELCGKYDNTEYFVCDLTKKTDIDALFKHIKNYNVELFINNAGFGDCGYFKDTELKKDLSMIDTNVKALHIMTKYALNLMNQGHILNVGSIAGLMPGGPYMATYYATKSYVVSFTRSIAHELKENKSKVSMHVLCPGPVNTEFNENANVKFALDGIEASDCVHVCLKDMFKGKTTIIPTLQIKAASLCAKVIPAMILVGICAHQQRKKIYR